MNRSFRVRSAIRNQHLTGARIEGSADLLKTFVRPARYEHKIVLEASSTEWLGWSYDETDDLIIPRQEVYEWLTVFAEDRLQGAWDTCLLPREVTVTSPPMQFPGMSNARGLVVKHTLFDLVISFEHEDDAMLFRLKWTGAGKSSR